LKEGWGLTNIEANACGTAVIAADVPGLKDSVQHGHNGYLYPYGDIAALEAALYGVISDRAQRARLEQGALEWARSFSWDQGAQELAHLMDEVIAAKSGSG